MRAPSMLIAAVLAASSLGVASAASALVPADVTLTAGPVSTVVSVSPDVYYDDTSATYYLYTTGMRIGVYSSKDGSTWAEVPGASTPSPAFDPSVISMPDGTYRMYFMSRSGMGPQACSGKQLKYATSTDLVRWTAQSAVLLDDLGCGVPNVVRAGDRDFRLYYVRGGSGVEHGTYMATSPDGLTWTPRAGILTPKDFVDPSVVQLPNGSWLMLAADFPPGKSSGPFLQKLYAGTSSDGFTWDFDAATPLYNGPPGEGAFDPDAVVLPDGSIRAWWAQGTSPDTAVVAAGTVTVAVSPDPEPVVPVPPTKPTVTTGKPGITVSWTYAVGAPAPDAFVVQVKSGTTWKDVARTEDTTASVTWTKVGAKKGKAFSVRVLAVIGDESAVSPSTRATRPR
jgi:hypothetical protein